MPSGPASPTGPDERAAPDASVPPLNPQAILELCPDAIIVVDAAWRCLYANPAAERLAGRHRDAMMGQTLWELAPMLAGTGREEVVRRAAAEHRPVTLELSPLAIGPIYEMRVVPTQDGATIYARDVTEQRIVESALRRRGQEFTTLAEHALDIIARFDRDLRHVYVNPAITSTTGLPPAAFIGKTHDQIGTAPETARLIANSLREVFETGRALEQHFEYPDGTGKRCYHSRLVPELSADGHTVETVLVISRDVTEQRLLEAQLRQAQKLEAVGQLAGGIAHDFNNLLTAIASNVELALDALPAEHFVREDLAEIKQAAARAASLTRQLLAFSRKQVLRPRVLSVNEVVTSTERLLRRVLDESVVLVTDLAPALGMVCADPIQLEQVLVNLAVNARDAMPTGGTLIIRTANVDVSPDGSRDVGVPAGSYVRLEIQDTGIGMDDATQARIFEPFFSTKEPGKGTGLGLATVYGIVQQSGGFIRVKSALQRGSTFVIHLPRAAEQTPDPILEPPRATAPRPGGGRLLLVEDEPAVRISVRRILEKNGYQIYEATNGAEALQIWDREHGAIDLVLSDLVMPGMGGHELVEQLRARQPDVRVVLMSGYTEAAGSMRDIRSLGVAMVEKPFEVAALLTRLREVLAGDAQVAEARSA
jgi:PAS domain S-box-containing protein